MASLGGRLKDAAEAGVSLEKVTIDPGIGHWTPPKGPGHDLAILDGLPRLRVLKRPVMAAVSRKSFIGAVLNKTKPAERLQGLSPPPPLPSTTGPISSEPTMSQPHWRLSGWPRRFEVGRRRPGPKAKSR